MDGGGVLSDAGPGDIDGGGGGDDAGPGDDDAGPGGDDGGAGGTTWTVFVYGHGDHNLSATLLADIEEMQGATFGDELEVIVLADFDSSVGHAEGASWLRVTPGTAMPEILSEEPEMDLDDAAVLRGAITRAFTDYEADRYGIVMWDHGGAWSGGFGGDSSDGAGHGEGIDIPTLTDAIRGGLDDAGITGRIDFLTFDTCLMSGPEVIYPMRDIAEVYFANAELDYGVGWDYTATLTWLGANPSADVRTFAVNEVMHWEAHHTTEPGGGAEDLQLRTHTAIDMTRVDAFTTAMDDLVTAWTDSSTFDDVDAAYALIDARPGYNNGRIDEIVQDPRLRDLGDFLDLMSMATSDPAVASAANDAYTALDDLIIASSLGSLRTNQVGVHIQLPSPNTVSEDIASYRTLAAAWVGATAWDGALMRLEGAADAVPPAPTIMGEGTLTDPSPTSRARSRVMTPADDVSEATVFLTGIDPTDTNKLNVYGLIAAGDVDPSSEYVLEWDGGQYVIGTENVALMPFITSDASVDAGMMFLTVPIEIIDGGDRLEAQLLVDASDGSILDVVVTIDDHTSVFELVELAGVEFVPIIPSYDLATDTELVLEGGTITIPTDGMLQLDYADALAGEYFVLTEVNDVWGNSEIDGFSVTVSP